MEPRRISVRHFAVFSARFSWDMHRVLCRIGAAGQHTI